jgi:hypothetical protein
MHLSARRCYPAKFVKSWLPSKSTAAENTLLHPDVSDVGEVFISRMGGVPFNISFRPARPEPDSSGMLPDQHVFKPFERENRLSCGAFQNPVGNWPKSDRRISPAELL